MPGTPRPLLVIPFCMRGNHQPHDKFKSLNKAVGLSTNLSLISPLHLLQGPLPYFQLLAWAQLSALGPRTCGTLCPERPPLSCQDFSISVLLTFGTGLFSGTSCPMYCRMLVSLVSAGSSNHDNKKYPQGVRITPVENH